MEYRKVLDVSSWKLSVGKFKWNHNKPNASKNYQHSTTLCLFIPNFMGIYSLLPFFWYIYIYIYGINPFDFYN